jgi:Holliday junction resolvasome RuvABC DNA-binding subunit
MAGEADEAHFALLLRFEQRLCSATTSNEQLRIILKDDAVNLSEIKVVGLKTTQRLLEHLDRERTIAAVSADLGHDEGFVALAFEAKA